jgi:hypothetical protein
VGAGGGQVQFRGSVGGIWSWSYPVLLNYESYYNSMKSFIFIALFLQQTAFAGEALELYQTSRYLGMGGAMVAVANDETALLANPAGLGRVRGAYGTMLDPELELGSNAYSMYNTDPFSNPFEPSDIKDTVNAVRNEWFHAKLQLFPSYVVRNFGLGILLKNEMNVKMNDAGTAMTTNYREDRAAVLGINFRWFDGRVKLGANLKAISRVEINADLDPAAALDLPSVASEGAAVATDVGLMLTAPWTWLPTLGAVVRDVGGTKFSASSGLRFSGSTRPADVAQDIDVGLALFPLHGNRSRSTFTVEQKSLTKAAADDDKSKYLHVGWEYNLYDILFFRLGMNQRYWTAGVELASEHTQIQLTSYGEEVGTATSNKEDRRYAFKFGFRF